MKEKKIQIQIQTQLKTWTTHSILIVEEERFETLELIYIERKLQKKDKIANTDTRKYNYKQKQKVQIQKINYSQYLDCGGGDI